MVHKSFSSAHGITLGFPIDRPLPEGALDISLFIAMDPPKHDVQRKTVAPVVSARNMAGLEPLIREHLYHSCDVGRQPKTLKKEFKNYDFSNLEKYWWNNNIPINEKLIKQESHNDIRNRLIKFLLKMRNLDANNIVLVSHGTFLSQITDYMMDNCEFFICNYQELCKKFSI